MYIKASTQAGASAVQKFFVDITPKAVAAGTATTEATSTAGKTDF
jgi:hypothetical protein